MAKSKHKDCAFNINGTCLMGYGCPSRKTCSECEEYEQKKEEE